MSQRKAPEELRSYRWFGPNDMRSFGHRSRARQMGLGPEDWEGKPVIAILNTWSDINPCHLHFKVLAENVRKGILGSAALPSYHLSLPGSDARPGRVRRAGSGRELLQRRS